jgi:hypothetical protein
MASAPANLPIFYNDLMPLNLRDHKNWRCKPAESADWIIGQHAVPLTVDEFSLAQRHFPIVFSTGDNPVPLALFGLNEGVNVYVDDKGQLEEQIYLPAYVRRYPFMLARIDPNNDDMTLCFDPSCKVLGEFKDGEPLFTENGASDFTKNIMQFCERFEQSGQLTQTFIDELKKHDLLMDGEVSIKRNEADENAQPFVYRGFKMINYEKFKEVRGDQLRTWNQNGFLALVHAHILSLDLLRVIFAKQTAKGKGPGAAAGNAKAEEKPKAKAAEKPKKSKK